MLTPGAAQDIIDRALALDLAFSTGEATRQHVPFSLTPNPVRASEYQALVRASLIFSTLTQALAANVKLIEELHAPLASGDRFFAELLSIHRELHGGGNVPAREPLLLQRSDFMLDEELGPRLIECNSIAAGMAPFGEQTMHLHNQLRKRWPKDYNRFSEQCAGNSIANKAIANLALAVASAAQRMRSEHNDHGAPGFLMVVQENEDNIFDQRLLERELQSLGIRTFRRTFRQLHEQLDSGPNQRLMLSDCGAIDVVYLRAGYRYRDYYAPELDAQRCCDALRATRVFIEQHRVVVNATVAQQLATSKRMQQYLYETPVEWLPRSELSVEDLSWVKQFLVEMRSVDERSADWLKAGTQSDDWVLKNQGEGGGHCVFGRDMLDKLGSMAKSDYGAWVLMRRLRPKPRVNDTLVIRAGEAQLVAGLVSEIGIFTAHMGPVGSALAGEKLHSNLGYLVRSKPFEVTEGGVHSGMGVLDSLVYRDE